MCGAEGESPGVEHGVEGDGATDCEGLHAGVAKRPRGVVTPSPDAENSCVSSVAATSLTIRSHSEASRDTTDCRASSLE
jgi:hypothetical protein